MNLWLILGEISFAAAALFFLLLALSSFREKQRRASGITFFFLLGLVLLNGSFFLAPDEVRDLLFGLMTLVVVLSAFLVLFFPLSKQSIKITGVQDRVDERDTIFARFDLQEGTPRFEEYYRERAALQERDAEIRKMPDILSQTHLKKDTVLQSLAGAVLSSHLRI